MSAIGTLATYFGTTRDGIETQASIVETFVPGWGWRPIPGVQESPWRPSGEAVASLARQGCLSISVQYGNRRADFTTAELLP